MSDIMTAALGALRTLALGISPNETRFSRRGFQAATPAVRERLERVGETFVIGYQAALRAGEPEGIGRCLDDVPSELRGFAFEGAAMAFALLDILHPRRRDRLHRFIEADGAPHVYMLHVGAGWALARLRRPMGPGVEPMDPLLGWLAADGYGFHEGYFAHARAIGEQAIPTRVRGYARRAFDQGLGRSLWFVRGADVLGAAATIGDFPAARRGDLWSGIGLAATYAGGASREALEALRALAGEHAPHLGQGAVFAAKARERAGCPAEHTEIACAVLAGCSAARAAAIADEGLPKPPLGEGDEPAYEVWRQRIRAALREEGRRS